ncbi:hypothetical protein AAJCM20276_20850 [Acetobacter aceti]|uniref:Uncharacterized protein n=1 Tax=Acetobacter aceti TaxID=435 RepID=A0A6S6PLC7_ACEAC|nr:hypothetical protein AAJCM20276_20850 [Acetobacter aceti]
MDPVSHEAPIITAMRRMTKAPRLAAAKSIGEKASLSAAPNPPEKIVRQAFRGTVASIDCLS